MENKELLENILKLPRSNGLNQPTIAFLDHIISKEFEHSNPERLKDTYEKIQTLLGKIEENYERINNPDPEIQEDKSIEFSYNMSKTSMPVIGGIAAATTYFLIPQEQTLATKLFASGASGIIFGAAGRLLVDQVIDTLREV